HQGPRQRVALARALVYEPSIMLLDEPLSALDKKLRTDLQWELRKLNKESGASFLYVTHDQEEALSMSDRIVIFNHGRIAQIGTPSQLYEHPADLFVAGFLGRSNVLDGVVRDAAPDSLYLDYEGGVLGVPRVGAWSAGDRVSVAVRPHRLRLRAAGQGLRAKVEAISYVGNLMHYLLRTPAGAPLYAEHVAGDEMAPAPVPGDWVGVVFDAAHVSVLEPRTP
ncbi:MAG TPA: ABC transporter ATP-binding protein, partial [Bordetella sp.]